MKTPKPDKTRLRIPSSGPPPKKPNGRAWGTLAAVLLVVITTAFYVPAFHGGFIWDDDDYVTGNQTLRSLSGLAHIWFQVGATPQYYPLVHTTYWIEYHLWGLNPAGYHVVNVLLHAASAILLWRLLAALRVPGAWVATAVFAVHPVNVESVAWITERKNVLSGVFYLAAALTYLRFAFDPGETAPRSMRIRWYAVSLLLFLGALLSKTVTGSLPAAILLVLWWKRGRIRWADVSPLLPFFVLAFALGSLTASMEKHRVGAVGSEWNFSTVDRFLIAGRALWFYAGKLVWPAHLTFIYPRWDIDADMWWQYLYPMGALAVVVAMWMARRRLGRGPLAAILFFVGTLVPALGFFSVFPMRYSFVADHFQYLASAGLIVLAVAAGTMTAAALSTSGRRAASVFAACILVLLGALTWRQERVYTDLETLWRDTLDKNPDAWIAHNNLAPILAGQGKLDEAIGHCNEALRLKPAYPEAHVTLGNLMLNQGKLDEAIKHYSEAVRLKPDYVQAHVNLGNVLLDQGRIDEAIGLYTEALQLNPSYPETHNSLGNALFAQSKLDEAVTQYTEALRLRPAFPEAHNNMGMVLANQGKLDEAVTHYTEALRLEPAFAAAYHNRGAAYGRIGDYDRAIADLSKAIELQPDNASAYCDRGNACFSKGNLDQAIRDYTRAIELRPDFAETYSSRGMAFYSLRESEKAWADVRMCRQLGGTPDPEFVRKLAESTGLTK